MKYFLLFFLSVGTLQCTQKSKRIVVRERRGSALLHKLLCKFVVTNDLASLKDLFSKKNIISPVNAYFKTDLIVPYAKDCKDQFMLQAVTSPSVKFNQWKLLSLAVIAHCTDIMKLLVRYGADINAQDALGWTALTWAGCSGDMKAVLFLVSQGADDSLKTKSGKTVIDLAEDKVSVERWVGKGKRARIQNIKKISQTIKRQTALSYPITDSIAEYQYGPLPEQNVEPEIEEVKLAVIEDEPSFCCYCWSA
jgi:ankyrin repeat protein